MDGLNRLKPIRNIRDEIKDDNTPINIGTITDCITYSIFQISLREVIFPRSQVQLGNEWM
jgi:hypothetical protein